MMGAERSEIHFGYTVIPYAVRRSYRRASVSIAIDPTLGVLLTAPKATSIQRLDRVVHAKARWILERLQRLPDEIDATPSREFVSGETFLYLGRQHRLRAVADNRAKVSLGGGWLNVSVPALTTAGVKRALVIWFSSHASVRISSRVATWAKKLGLPTPIVLIRDQRRRWASCDPKGNLRFNWRIIQAPMRLLDYVVVHELVHLTHRAHSKAFWAALGKIMPDYESRREELRVLGPQLQW